MTQILYNRSPATEIEHGDRCVHPGAWRSNGTSVPKIFLWLRHDVAPARNRIQVEETAQTAWPESDDRAAFLLLSCAMRDKATTSRPSWLEIDDRELRWRRLYAALDELAKLERDWNSYDAMPPNTMSREYARMVLDEMGELNLIPERVVASAEEGVGIYTPVGNKYAIIECFNDGSMVVGVSDRLDDIRTWEIAPDKSEIRTALKEVMAFLYG